MLRQVDNVLATALQIIRADELFYWLTPRLERGIATITGMMPESFSQPIQSTCIDSGCTGFMHISQQAYLLVPSQDENGKHGSQVCRGAVLRG